MATATKSVKVIEVETVTLTLNKEEALTLHAILESVGGMAEFTARRHADDVLTALEAAGVHTTERTVSLNGSIIFEGQINV